MKKLTIQEARAEFEELIAQLDAMEDSGAKCLVNITSNICKTYAGTMIRMLLVGLLKFIIAVGVGAAATYLFMR